MSLASAESVSAAGDGRVLLDPWAVTGLPRVALRSHFLLSEFVAAGLA